MVGESWWMLLVEEGKRGGRLVVDAELRSERRVAVISHSFRVVSTCPPSLVWPPEGEVSEAKCAEFCDESRDCRLAIDCLSLP